MRPVAPDLQFVPKDTNPKDSVGVRKVPSSVVPRTVVGEIGLGMLEGSCGYGRHNYRVAPVRASIYFDAANRHLDAWWEGQDIDPKSGLSHVTKALSSLVVLRDAMIQGSWFDDRPPPAPEGWQESLNTKAGEILDKFPEPRAPYLARDTERPPAEQSETAFTQEDINQIRTLIADWQSSEVGSPEEIVASQQIRTFVKGPMG